MMPKAPFYFPVDDIDVKMIYVDFLIVTRN